MEIWYAKLSLTVPRPWLKYPYICSFHVLSGYLQNIMGVYSSSISLFKKGYLYLPPRTHKNLPVFFLLVLCNSLSFLLVNGQVFCPEFWVLRFCRASSTTNLGKVGLINIIKSYIGYSCSKQIRKTFVWWIVFLFCTVWCVCVCACVVCVHVCVCVFVCVQAYMVKHSVIYAIGNC